MKRVKILITYMALIFIFGYSTYFFTAIQKRDTLLEVNIIGDYSSYTSAEIFQMSNLDLSNNFILTDPKKVEKTLMDTQRFETVDVKKDTYRKITITVDSKVIVGKTIIDDEIKYLSEDGKLLIASEKISTVPVFSERLVANKNDLESISKSLAELDSTLLENFVYVDVTNVEEIEKTYKLTTTDENDIFIRKKGFKHKISKYFEMDAIMNTKTKKKCEYHFEYSDTNVTVKER